MKNDLFYCNVEHQQFPSCSDVIDELRAFSSENQVRMYVLNAPLELADEYDYQHCFVVAVPNRKVALVCVDASEEFETFCEDVYEDIGILSSKYGYIKKLGRPRIWKTNLFTHINDVPHQSFMNAYKVQTALNDRKHKRLSTLVTSLLIGSINDINSLEIDVPDTIIDSVRQKVVLFDGQQSRFIYENLNQKRIVIQGMAGTGKTELLLHKLRELYTTHPDGRDYKLFFTCHNRVLANSMRRRITSFFNYMKVDEQIEWGDRLHVARSWGSRHDPESGLYSFICHKYGLSFQSYGENASFDAVCRNALESIPKDAPACLDYILIDESQDFSESFFALCERVTSNRIFVAGDVFQDIYEERNENDLKVDYLLRNCYRTDPRTLLFAHALGLGLCEKPVIQWLSKEMWDNCGYVLKDVDNRHVSIKRHPINRFGTDDSSGGPLISPIEIRGTGNFVESIICAVSQIKDNHPTVSPGDIAIVFVGSGHANYAIADQVAAEIGKRFGWGAVFGYEKKQTDENCVFISNRNNIKGLEFPFIICFAIGEITRGLAMRNALYMILTRSFLTSYLIYNESYSDPIKKYILLANRLREHPDIVVRKPSDHEAEEQLKNVTKLLAQRRAKSLEELVVECLVENGFTGSNLDDAKKRLMVFFKTESGEYDGDDLRSRVMRAIPLLNHSI